jgi:SAM-dependent methyltransferase
MKIVDPTQGSQTPPVNEVKLMLETLPFDGARVLELGCGRAEKTRTLAETGRPREILALEVDAIQHAKNLQITDLPGVRFAHGGAEAIPAPDASFDIVIMFKSLHHVPVAHMDAALDEIARVLKPGGLAWISEPVFAGELNEIMRLFHDEKVVREAAFAAVCRAVERGPLQLKEERFFTTRSQFDDFAQFDARMIRVTHSNHTLSPELYRGVREKFDAHLTPQGVTFINPQRVDLLQKPA